MTNRPVVIGPMTQLQPKTRQRNATESDVKGRMFVPKSFMKQRDTEKETK